MKLIKKLSAISLTIILLNLAVLPALPVLAASIVVNISPVSGPPGTSAIASGAGFTAGNSYSVSLVMKFVPTEVADGTVPAGGAIGAVFSVPVLPRGIYNVNITTAADTTALPLPTFTVTPQIFIDTSSGDFGDKINVNGNGFSASQKVSIIFDAAFLGSVTTDSQGTFSDTAVTIPQVLGGNHSISAKDADGSSPSVNFVVLPKVTLSAGEITVGSTVNVSGSGFAASKTIYPSIDSLAASGKTTSDTTGKFTNYSLKIPQLAQGTHSVVAKDSLGNTAKIDFSIIPSISINPAQGTIGTEVTITGNGFPAIGNNPISISYNGIIVVTSPAVVNADANGNFGANFKIPPGTSNTGIIIVSDSSNKLSVNFNSVANITVTPLSGHVGDPITAAGTGFKSNTAIKISLDTAQAGTATTDADGKFTVTFSLPDSTNGTHQITVADQVNTLKYAFDVIPEFKIAPLSGSAGQDITLSGTGYAALADITVTFDYIQVVNTKTDISGTFAATFKAPAGEDGIHKITFSTGADIITSDFTMSSTPVPSPVLVSPQKLSQVSKTPALDWQDVNIPGVTYTLQISGDSTFLITLLQKDGLKTSEYQLTSQEALGSVSQDAPYYWRVKAVDSAKNESKWSAPLTFYVAPAVSTSVYYAVVAGFVIIVAAVAFFIEKRRAH